MCVALLVAAVFLFNILSLIREKIASAALAALPFSNSSSGKSDHAAGEGAGDDAEDGVSALEAKAGISPKGITRVFGDRTVRYPHRDVLCLARAIYHDGRDLGPSGRAAIAQVAMNRLATLDFGASLCEVVYRGMGRQFGCMFRDACRAVGSVPNDMARWSEALSLSVGVLKGDVVVADVGEATHFHKHDTKPRWLRRVTPSGEIDGLVLSVEKHTIGVPPAVAAIPGSSTARMSAKRRNQSPVAAGFDHSARSSLGGPPVRARKLPSAQNSRN